MGLQGRYFGRWLLPIFPIAVPARGVLRAAARPGAIAQRLSGATGGRRAGERARSALIAVAVIALLRPGARLQRPLGPRAGARRHAQPDARVDGRAHPRRRADRGRAGRARTTGRATLEQVPPRRVSLDHVPAGGASRRTGSTHQSVGIEDYERRSAPALIGYYERTATAGWSAARRSPGERSPTRGRCRWRSPTTARWRSGRGRLPRLALRARAAARSRSASTGASTTTRSPTTARDRR